jgi:hypothetical protein
MTNDQIIYNVAIKNGFSPTAAKLVVAQARFESSDYNSNVFNNNINTSGMKYIGQPLGIRGTLAPYKERSSGCQAVTKGQVGGQGAYPCKDSDHYAKFRSVEDSARDKIERLFQKTMGGVTPQQIKNASTPREFAELMKKRSYYGFHKYGTLDAEKEINNYASGMAGKLLRINVIEFVRENKKGIAGTIFGILLVATSYYIYKKYYK